MNEPLVPGNIQLVGDTGHFYTILTVDSVDHVTVETAAADSEPAEDPRAAVDAETEDGGDILVCGRCRSHFSQVSKFLEHKRRGCRDIKEGDNEEELAGDENGVFFSVDSSFLGESTAFTQIYLENNSTSSPLVSVENTHTAAEENNITTTSTVRKKGSLEISLVPQPSSGNATIPLPSHSPLAENFNNEKKSKLTARTQKPIKDKKIAKKLYCSYCDKGFNKNFDLAQHVRSHTGERPYQCVICGRGFAQKSNVKKHMATHKVWPLGHKTLPSGEVAGTEQAEEGQVGAGTSYECPYCRESLATYLQLKTHLKVHEEEKSYKCIVRGCGLMFHDLALFLDHTRSHQDKLYRCHICSKMFKDLNQLNLHSYSHLTDEQTREKQFFQCSKCKNKYTSMEALDHHLDTATHSFTCDICDKEFTAERLLRKHITVTHSEGNFECAICKKKMKNEHYLKSHMMIHTGELPFECKDCGAKFNRNDKLKRHSLTHSDQKKYKCPFREHTGCSKEFHRFDKLKLHIMTHGNIKPFKCDICDAGFSRKEHLTAHTAKIHLGGKGKFPCTICEKALDSSADLSDHMNTEHIDNRNIAKAVGLKKEAGRRSAKKSPDTRDRLTEYVLPDQITTAASVEDSTRLGGGSSSAQSLDTFTSCAVAQSPGEEERRGEAAGSTRQQTTITVSAAAACEAMEVLYSGNQDT